MNSCGYKYIRFWAITTFVIRLAQAGPANPRALIPLHGALGSHPAIGETDMDDDEINDDEIEAEQADIRAELARIQKCIVVRVVASLLRDPIRRN